jgi:hypothetical protein
VTVTAASFKVAFPEFVTAPDAIVTARIGMAQRRTPAGIWGDLEDDGVSYLTAHLLALAPSARDMRKGEKPGETMYGRERKILEAIVSSGFRTAGTSPYVPTEDV